MLGDPISGRYLTGSRCRVSINGADQSTGRFVYSVKTGAIPRTRAEGRGAGSSAAEYGSLPKCSFVCALLSIAPRTKQNETHDEDIQAGHGKRRSSHNPGDGGERAVAFLADAPRARAAG
jgi:hypothetical protein